MESLDASDNEDETKQLLLEADQSITDYYRVNEGYCGTSRLNASLSVEGNSGELKNINDTLSYLHVKQSNLSSHDRLKKTTTNNSRYGLASELTSKSEKCSYQKAFNAVGFNCWQQHNGRYSVDVTDVEQTNNSISSFSRIFWNEFLDHCFQSNFDVKQCKLFLQNNKKWTRMFDRWVIIKVVEECSIDVVKCLMENVDWHDLNDYHVLKAAIDSAKNPREKLIYFVQERRVNPYSEYKATQPVPIEMTFTKLSLLQAFVDDCSLDVNKQYSGSTTAIYRAVCRNALPAALFLLWREADCDILFANYTKATPFANLCCRHDEYKRRCTELLGLTIERGESAILRRLLKAAEICCPKDKIRIVNAKPGANTSLLHMAVKFGSIEVRQRETSDDILWRMQQADDMVTSLLEHGADVLAVNASDETPLHVAVRRHCKVRRLLEHGQRESQLTARDANGFTPLATAIVYIKNNSLKHLISKRYFQSCSFVVSDNRQRSLMHLAIEEHNMYAIELLLNKLDVGQMHPDWHKLTDCDGNTPLDVASVRGDESVVQLILEHSDRKDETRSQSFLSAAARGHLETCKMIVTVTNGECLRASPDSGNSSLHLAAYNGRLDIVKFLVDKMGVSAYLTNYCRQIPLHMAARNNHLDVVQFLVSRDKQCVNFSDSAGMTSLHYAAMFDCLDVVNYLLSCGGSVSARDVIRRNALDVAIDRGHYETCCAILSCRDQWSSALDSVACFDDDVQCQNLSENVLAALNVDRLPSRDFNVMTPIRRMIEKMPQLVKIVCDKCTTKIDKNTTKYFVKFFDDSLINHPVSLMIKHRREELLYQPLVIALINHKGKVALGFYLTFLTLNVCLVSLTTAFVVNSEPPQNVNWTKCYLPNTELNYRDQSTTFLVASVWFLISLGVLVEILQFRTVRHKYVREFTNYFDWFCYITTVLITLSVTPCGALTYWQWQLSAFSILASWINFITFLRRIPACGIHVAMVEQVGLTFLRFFIILFLFIIAFGFAFYILLQNQHPFASPADSLLKTAVMMTGEYDFTSIFYGHLESDEESSQIFYKASTSAVHALFLTTIFVIVDLLIGMAVGDISQLTKNAKFERLKMTFDLIFDVELNLQTLPYRLRYLFIWNRDEIVESDKRNVLDQLLHQLKSVISFGIHSVDKETSDVDQIIVELKQSGRAEREKLKNEMSLEINQLKRSIKEISSELGQLRSDTLKAFTNEISQLKQDILNEMALKTTKLPK